MKHLPLLLLIIICVSCGENKKQSGNTTDTLSAKDSASINPTYTLPDEYEQAEMQNDTFINEGIKYYVSYAPGDSFHIIREDGKKIFSNDEILLTYEITDFNEDGHTDVLQILITNTPNIQTFILYDKKTKSFKEVTNATSYPAAEKIKGTNYYYSYHRSGCSDMNWDSDLFYIEDYTIIPLGNISGHGCSTSGEKMEIIISKISEDEKLTPINTLPISTIEKYDDHKWGFIKHYWTTNYKKFLP